METNLSSLDKYKRVKVLVGIPSLNREWHEKFAMSLIYLMTYWQETRMGNFREETVKVASVKGSILPNVRLDLVKEAIKQGSTHLLLVDTDQTFPRNTLHRLIEADKDVIACNIATKQIPAQPTARYFNAENLGSGDRVYNDPRKGVEQVWRVGCGVMLIRMKVFERIGLDVWGMPWQPEAQKYQGEDWTFVSKCEEAGIPVFIDHTLSEEVKHIGDYAYDHNVVGEVVLESLPKLEVDMAKEKKTKVTDSCCAPVCGDYKPRLYLNLQDKQVAHIKGLTIGEEVTLRVSGKIVSLEQREHSDSDKKMVKTGSIDLEGYEVEVMGEEDNEFKKMAEDD